MAQRSKVGHYDIVAELGRGGMGVVYKGFEPSLQRHVAIKMLSEALADDTLVVERFFREARSMAQLNDPHIVQIYLVGEDQGQPYFAMEFVEGESLSQRLKREHRLEPFEAARVLLQVAQGLAAAHDRGVIHRDIKPANLLITQRGVVKVADFGIALATSDFNKKLTGTGQFVGTPGYLSPEVCLGKPVDQRSDIFALGIVFFEMLAGQTPYKDESPLGMMLEVVQAEIPDVRAINESVDPRLSEILKRMVAKEPGDRYGDCHQLIADLVAAGVNAATPVTPARAQLAPVLETAVNMPTPPELRRPTPPPALPAVPAPGYHTQPSAEQPMPVAAPVPAQPSRPALVQTRKSSALPWAAAIVALVAAGGGAAWYLQNENSTAASDVPATVAAVNPVTDITVPSAAPATPSPVEPSAQAPAPVPTTAANPAPTPEPVPAAALPNVSEPAPAVAEVMSAPAVAEPPPAPSVPETMAPAEAAPVTVAEAAPTSAGQAPRASAPEIEPSPQSAAIGARLADIRDQRRERREARASAAAPRQYAKAETAPSVAEPAHAGPPRVLVLSQGDAAVAGSAELAIEERLEEIGLVLVDEDFTAGLSGIENGGRDLASIAATAGRHAEFVVFVRVVPIGQQELTFYGESMTQYTVRIDVAAFDVRARRKMGAGWNAQVSFTHLNADPNTREAIAPVLGRMAQGFGGRGRG